MYNSGGLAKAVIINMHHYRLQYMRTRKLIEEGREMGKKVGRKEEFGEGWKGRKGWK
jgi:hypothetical protein